MAGTELQEKLLDVASDRNVTVKFRQEALTKFNVLKEQLLPKLDKAQDEKEFNDAKKECEDKLQDLQIDHDAANDMLDDLEKNSKKAQSLLDEERKRIADLKKKLKEINDRIDKHNKAVKEFNKTAPKKDQKKLIKPDDSLAKLIQAEDRKSVV